MSLVYGFDASSVQGDISCAALDPELRFGIVKCWQGNDGGDPRFAANVASLQAAGLQPFAYCFAYPLPGKAGVFGRAPKEQAKLFFDHAWALLPGRPIFVDAEWPEVEHWAAWGCTAQSISEWLRECCEELTTLCGGVRPAIYTYPWWWAAVSKADVSWAAAYSLWLAAYVKAKPVDGEGPHVPAPWSDWLFWQWDGNGGARLPNGVDADFCAFNGDEAALAAFAGACT